MGAGEESPSLRCPKCGSGNVVGYQGVWECMDCGFKFSTQVSPLRQTEPSLAPASMAERKGNVGRIIIGIIGLILGVLSTLIGWMGYGGYIFGIPAIIVGTVLYRKGMGVLPLLAIIFGAIGLAETIAVAHIFIPAIERTMEEIGPKEEYITLPHTFEVYEGKVEISSLEVKKADYVSREIIEGEYFVVHPRKGFVFYIVKFRVKNVGGSIIGFTDMPCCFELYTNKNIRYEERLFYQMTKERGYETFQSNDEKYAENLCHHVGHDLYPEEEVEGCVVFEVKEDEKPIKIGFLVSYESYYIELP